LGHIGKRAGRGDQKKKRPPEGGVARWKTNSQNIGESGSKDALHRNRAEGEAGMRKDVPISSCKRERRKPTEKRGGKRGSKKLQSLENLPVEGAKLVRDRQFPDARKKVTGTTKVFSKRGVLHKSGRQLPVRVYRRKEGGSTDRAGSRTLGAGKKEKRQTKQKMDHPDHKTERRRFSKANGFGPGQGKGGGEPSISGDEKKSPAGTGVGKMGETGGVWKKGTIARHPTTGCVRPLKKTENGTLHSSSLVKGTGLGQAISRPF